MKKPKGSYTTLGKRISALCGNQNRVSMALGLDRSMVSRKLHGAVHLTVEELFALSTHFGFPIWLFFVEPDMDGASIRDCYRMFLYNPIALDWILEAFRKDRKNLKKLGKIAERLCKGDK